MWATVVAFCRNARAVLTVILFLKKAAAVIAELIGLREQKKESEQMQQAENKIDEANKIENDAERLKAKAEAACEIEKILNPDSNCK